MMTAFFILCVLLICFVFVFFILESKSPTVVQRESPPTSCKENDHEWQVHAWDIDNDVYKCKKCEQTKQTKHYQ